MKNYFKKKLEIWKLCFAAARDFDFKGYTNPCNKPNKNTLPPPVGVPSYNYCHYVLKTSYITNNNNDYCVKEYECSICKDKLRTILK